MSEKLTVAELLARNARAGGRTSSERPRRHRNLETGGVSVSELTGSIPVVTIDGEGGPADADGAADADGRPDTRTKARRHHGHEAEPTGPESTVEPEPELVGPEPEPVIDAEAEPESEPEQDAASSGTAAAAGDTEDTVVDEQATGAVPGADPASATDAAPGTSTAPGADTAEAEESVAPVVSGSFYDDQPTTVQDAVPDNQFAGPGRSSVTGRQPHGRTDTQRVDEADATDEVSPSAPVAETVIAETAVAEPAVDEVTVDEPTGDVEDAAESTPVVPSGNEVLEYEDDSVSWPALLAQSVLAVIVGVLIFFGFTLLWDNLGTVMVLVMALVVTFVCVGVVHALLRHRDTLLLVLTFVVGIALTVGPRLIMSL